MASFLLALQFLTIIPVKVKYIDEKLISKSMVYFPIIGLLLGLILAGSDKLLYFFNLDAFAINTILVILLIALTGGMHLDGLADTADAFLSRKNKEGMLDIMRDSHIGVMGVLSLISIILLKIALFSSVNVLSRPMALLLMCVLSRWSAVWAMFLFPYARQDGKAKVFIQGMNLKIFMLSLIAALIFAFVIWRIKGLFVLLIIAGCTYLSSRIISRKIGGITGDTLGSTIEVMEIVTLFTVCIG